MFFTVKENDIYIIKAIMYLADIILLWAIIIYTYNIVYYFW